MQQFWQLIIGLWSLENAQNGEMVDKFLDFKLEKMT